MRWTEQSKTALGRTANAATTPRGKDFLNLIALRFKMVFGSTAERKVGLARYWIGYESTRR